MKKNESTPPLGSIHLHPYFMYATEPCDNVSTKPRKLHEMLKLA